MARSLSIPVLAWLAMYSFTKRFTWMCHFWLGASLGLAPIPPGLPSPPAAPVLRVPILLLGIGGAILGRGVRYPLCPSG